jgi:N-acetyltransferase
MLSANAPLERVELRGRRIVLEPLSPEHLPGLAAAIRDGELWSIPVTLVPHPDELPEFLKQAETRYAAQLERAFATVDIASGLVVGSTRFMAINRDHRRVEIGFTFLAQRWQRSYVNTEAKYLMLRHAFEEWECNRVELITDALNAKSRQAILRLGAKEEGVMRSHMIMRDGRVRDSVLYSIIQSEWPRVRSDLEAKIAAHGALGGAVPQRIMGR